VGWWAVGVASILIGDQSDGYFWRWRRQSAAIGLISSPAALWQPLTSAASNINGSVMYGGSISIHRGVAS